MRLMDAAIILNGLDPAASRDLQFASGRLAVKGNQPDRVTHRASRAGQDSHRARPLAVCARPLNTPAARQPAHKQRTHTRHARRAHHASRTRRAAAPAHLPCPLYSCMGIVLVYMHRLKTRI